MVEVPFVDAPLRQRWEKLCAHTTVADTLGIKFLKVSPQIVEISLEVDRRVMQPFGILHGGVSLVLAETVASIGGWANLSDDTFHVVGQEINANHLRPVTGGTVICTGTPIHLGRTSQVWEARVCTAPTEGSPSKLVCISRCTLAVVATRGAGTA